MHPAADERAVNFPVPDVIRLRGCFERKEEQDVPGEMLLCNGSAQLRENQNEQAVQRAITNCRSGSAFVMQSSKLRLRECEQFSALLRKPIKEFAKINPLISALDVARLFGGELQLLDYRAVDGGGRASHDSYRYVFVPIDRILAFELRNGDLACQSAIDHQTEFGQVIHRRVGAV